MKTKRILVIEDEAALRDRMVQMLEFEGFQAEGAIDGRTGIEMARNNPPDLVICDLLMPGINGFGACRVLRDDPATRDTPTLVVSALSTEGDRQRVADLGVKGFLTKPFRKEQLMDAVASCLGETA